MWMALVSEEPVCG